MTIIAGTFSGIIQTLRDQGFLYLADVKWISQPSRVNGRWSCEVVS
jgi:hypothetical protein